MSASFPIWRSMLFLPAHVEKFVASAHRRGADACILDLEDSVPLTHKALARDSLAAGVAAVTRSGGAALARINADPALLAADVEAAVRAGVAALVLPKVEQADQVREIAAFVDRIEAKNATAAAPTRLIAQIEDVRALPVLDQIATSSERLLGMILGSEDFSASAGMEPTPETLLWPNQMVAFACRRAGILPLGFPGSIADYRDLHAFRNTIRFARQLGFVGAFCIHPDQVAVLNEGFSPSAAEQEHARGLLAAWAQAQAEGRGACEYRGRMVDPPVVTRAEEVLRRSRILSQ